jgi:hypothetical protein
MLAVLKAAVVDPATERQHGEACQLGCGWGRTHEGLPASSEAPNAPALQGHVDGQITPE